MPSEATLNVTLCFKYSKVTRIMPASNQASGPNFVATAPVTTTRNRLRSPACAQIKPIQDRIELLDATKNDLEATIAKMRLSKDHVNRTV